MDKTLTQLIGSKPGLKIEKATSSDAFNNLNTTVQQDWQELYQQVTKIKTEPVWLNTSNAPIRDIPLLYKRPVVDGKIILSSRYINPIDLDED